MKTLRNLFLFLVLGLAAFSEAVPAKVVRVLDGDTVIMEIRGEIERVRFYGIDAPESDQPWGAEATQYVVEALEGAEVFVESTGRGHYGRIIARIYYDNGKYLNLELVEHGLAWWYRDYARRDDVLQKAHVKAMEDKVGLWEEPAALPPWEWRKKDY